MTIDIIQNSELLGSIESPDNTPLCQGATVYIGTVGYIIDTIVYDEQTNTSTVTVFGE